jgi:hypothetical protein
MSQNPLANSVPSARVLESVQKQPLTLVSEAAIDEWWSTLDTACKIECFNLFYESFVGSYDPDEDAKPSIEDLAKQVDGSFS